MTDKRKAPAPTDPFAQFIGAPTLGIKPKLASRKDAPRAAATTGKPAAPTSAVPRKQAAMAVSPFAHLRQAASRATAPLEKPAATSFADKVAASVQKARGGAPTEPEPGSFAAKLAAARVKAGRR